MSVVPHKQPAGGSQSGQSGAQSGQSGQSKQSAQSGTGTVSRAEAGGSKALKATLANKDVVSMFNDTLSPTDDPSKLPIIHKKYTELAALISRFRTALRFIYDMAPLAVQFPVPRAQLGEYLAALERQSGEVFVAPDIAKHIGPPTLVDGGEYATVPKELASECVKCYNMLKSHNLVNVVVVTCKNLTPHKVALADVDKLQDGFLLDAGHVYAPFPGLAQLNIKHIYQTFAARDRRLLLTVLSRLYTISHRVFEIVTSPDANLDELVSIVLSSIDDVKKSIPRCEDAFKKIAESVDLLRSNFSGYHKDYVVSGNSGIILENFVLDVAKNSKSSPRVTAQFREIIKRYRSMINTNDPKLRQLFGQAEANFREASGEESKAGAQGDAADAAAPASAQDSLVVAPATASGAKSNAVKNRKKKAKARARAAGASAAGDLTSELASDSEGESVAGVRPDGAGFVVTQCANGAVIVQTKKFTLDTDGEVSVSGQMNLGDMCDAVSGMSYAAEMMYERGLADELEDDDAEPSAKLCVLEEVPDEAPGSLPDEAPGLLPDDEEAEAVAVHT